MITAAFATAGRSYEVMPVSQASARAFGRQQLSGDDYMTGAAGVWALLASSSGRRPQQAASHRIDVAHGLVPGIGLWEAALLAIGCAAVVSFQR